MLALQCSVFAVLLIIYIIYDQQLSQQINCLVWYVLLIVLVDKFWEVWGRIWADIPVFIGNEDVEANVILFMTLSLSQFILLDIFHNLFGSSQFC